MSCLIEIILLAVLVLAWIATHTKRIKPNKKPLFSGRWLEIK